MSKIGPFKTFFQSDRGAGHTPPKENVLFGRYEEDDNGTKY